MKDGRELSCMFEQPLIRHKVSSLNLISPSTSSDSSILYFLLIVSLELAASFHSTLNTDLFSNQWIAILVPTKVGVFHPRGILGFKKAYKDDIT